MPKRAAIERNIYLTFVWVANNMGRKALFEATKANKSHSCTFVQAMFVAFI
jgi:hypothetical protein